MKLRIAWLAGAVIACSTSAWAQTAVSVVDQPIVHSGLFTVRPDGRGIGSAAVQTGDHSGADLAGTLYVSPCGGTGAANPDRPISAFASDVWQMSGKVVELGDQQASVQIGWRRVRRDGRDEHSAEQVATLTLKRGERNTLETIAVPPSGSCEGRTMSLDVVFASRQELYGITADAYARGGGRTSNAGSSGNLQSGHRSGTGGSGDVVSVGVSKAGGPGPERLSADLWLVRSTPGRTDETFHITSQIIPAPLTYAFAPITIQAAAGPLTIKVEGTLETGLTSDGERRFHFTATRSVTSATSSRPARDSKPIVEGSTKTTVPLPGPEEVLSFEMPPLRTADGVTLPDRLSIRVRVGSSQK